MAASYALVNFSVWFHEKFIQFMFGVITENSDVSFTACAPTPSVLRMYTSHTVLATSLQKPSFAHFIPPKHSPSWAARSMPSPHQASPSPPGWQGTAFRSAGRHVEGMGSWLVRTAPTLLSRVQEKDLVMYSHCSLMFPYQHSTYACIVTHFWTSSLSSSDCPCN